MQYRVSVTGESKWIDHQQMSPGIEAATRGGGHVDPASGGGTVSVGESKWIQ